MTTTTKIRASARNQEEYLESGDGYAEYPLDVISPSALNPRKVFDEAALRELAESLKTHGMIEPIVVRIVGDSGGEGGTLEIICGERRWRAAKTAGLLRIPVRILQNIDDRTALEMALTENLARKDINPIEEAEGYRALRDLAGLKVTEIALRVNRDPSTISNAIRIAEQLPEEIKDKIRCGELTASHGKALIPYAQYPKMLECKLKQALNGVPTKELEKLDGAWQYAQAGALVELCSDHIGVKAAKECLKCKHRRKCEYRDGWYCLKIECAEAKKNAWNDALIAEMTEKVSAGEVIKVSDLHYGTYEYLEVAPPGCREDCESRKIALRHSGQPCTICVNPECLNKLKAAHSRILGKERKQSHNETLEAAIAALDVGNLTTEMILLGCWMEIRHAFTEVRKAAIEHLKLPLTEGDFKINYGSSTPECWEKLLGLDNAADTIIRLAAEISIRQEIASGIRNGFAPGSNHHTNWLLEHAAAERDMSIASTGEPDMSKPETEIDTTETEAACDISDVTSIPEEDDDVAESVAEEGDQPTGPVMLYEYPGFGAEPVWVQLYSDITPEILFYRARIISTGEEISTDVKYLKPIAEDSGEAVHKPLCPPYILIHSEYGEVELLGESDKPGCVLVKHKGETISLMIGFLETTTGIPLDHFEREHYLTWPRKKEESGCQAVKEGGESTPVSLK